MNRIQRHLGRELALLWLFEVDVGGMPVSEVSEEVPGELEGVDEEGLEFAQALLAGVVQDRKRIDECIARYARGWPLSRMAGIERNILRIALYEILDVPDIPASVSIDEAVEIAKKYGTDESGKFVNGILGAFYRGEYHPPEQA